MIVRQALSDVTDRLVTRASDLSDRCDVIADVTFSAEHASDTGSHGGDSGGWEGEVVNGLAVGVVGVGGMGTGRVRVWVEV
jgi:hypothetical protein